MQSNSSKRPTHAVPTLDLGARGPRGEAGFLLTGKLPEGVVWDLENEIVSNRRLHLGRRGWWVASSYFDTALDIVLRFFPSVLVRYPETGEERVVHADSPPARREG